MTGIFKANNPSGNAILFFYALVLKLPIFLQATGPGAQSSDGVLYRSLLGITDPIAKGFPHIYNVLTFILLFTQAIGFNKIVNSQRLHKSPNYLTGMSYLLITSLFSEWFSLSAPLIVNSFMLFIWGRLCAVYNNPNPKATIFNIGLATGIATFVYFPSVAFLLLVITGITLARPFRVQEWLTGLFGILTPLYFFGAWLFLTDKLEGFHFTYMSFSYPRFFSHHWSYAAIGMIVIATVLGIYFINVNMNRQVVQTRKSLQLLFLYIIVAAVVSFINAGTNLSSLILLALPLSPVIAAAFFYPRKRWFPVMLHWAMFIVYTAVNFFMK